jgi:hypothetical protein
VNFGSMHASEPATRNCSQTTDGAPALGSNTAPSQEGVAEMTCLSESAKHRYQLIAARRGNKPEKSKPLTHSIHRRPRPIVLKTHLYVPIHSPLLPL